MSSKTFAWLSLLVSSFALTATAADPSPRRVQLRFVSLSQPILGAGVAGADGKATPLVIPAHSLSHPVSHTSGRLRLVSTQPAVAAPKNTDATVNPEDVQQAVPGFRRAKTSETTLVKAGNREIGSIDLPDGDHQRFIILVHPGRGSGLTPIPDRLGFFPPGSDRYVNLTSVSVIIDIPAGRQTLAPNGSVVLRPGATHLRQYHLRLLMKTSDEEKPFFSAFTAHDDGRRNLRIFIPGGPQGEGIILKSISDGLAAEDNYR
jgi:hypothetical protein